MPEHADRNKKNKDVGRGLEFQLIEAHCHLKFLEADADQINSTIKRRINYAHQSDLLCPSPVEWEFPGLMTRREVVESEIRVLRARLMVKKSEIEAHNVFISYLKFEMHVKKWEEACTCEVVQFKPFQDDEPTSSK